MKYYPKTVGRGYGFEFILWCVENIGYAALLPIPIALSHMYYYSSCFYWFPLYYLLSLLLPIISLFAYLIFNSWIQDKGMSDWNKIIKIHDVELAKEYEGKKIPMETVYESYLVGKLDFLDEDNLIEVLLRKNLYFRFCLTKNILKFFFRNFLNHITGK